MKTFDELWKELEENFDWEKVNKVMVFLDCKWYDSETNGIPSIERIKDHGKRCCNKAYQESLSNGNIKKTMGSGGFYGTYEEFPNHEVEPHNELTLEFTLESFSVW